MADVIVLSDEPAFFQQLQTALLTLFKRDPEIKSTLQSRTLEVYTGMSGWATQNFIDGIQIKSWSVGCLRELLGLRPQDELPFMMKCKVVYLDTVPASLTLSEVDYQLKGSSHYRVVYMTNDGVEAHTQRN